jgi:hypothetical protein
MGKHLGPTDARPMNFTFVSQLGYWTATSWRNFEQIKFRRTWLPFNTETVVFSSLNENVKFQMQADIRNYNHTCCYTSEDRHLVARRREHLRSHTEQQFGPGERK